MATFSTAARNALADAIGTQLSAGSLEVYTGTSPGPGSAATGTLLVTITLGTASTAASGVVNFGDPAAATPVAAGTAGYFRAKGSGGSAVFDGSVGTSGAELNLSSLALTTGSPVDVSSFTYTAPTS